MCRFLCNLYAVTETLQILSQNRLVPPQFAWYRLGHSCAQGRLAVFFPVPHSDRWDPWMVIILFAVLAVAAGLTFILL